MIVIPVSRPGHRNTLLSVRILVATSLATSLRSTLWKLQLPISKDIIVFFKPKESLQIHVTKLYKNIFIHVGQTR